MNSPFFSLILSFGSSIIIQFYQIDNSWRSLPTPSSLEVLNDLVERGMHPAFAGWALEKYFEESTNHRLRLATISNSSTVALSAKWKEYRDRFSRPEAAIRFVDFFEGRMSTIVPRDWERSLAERSIEVPVPDDLVASDLLPGLKIQDGCRIELRDNVVHIKVRDQNVLLKAREFEAFKPIAEGNFDRILVHTASDTHFFLLYSSEMAWGGIMCVRNDSIVWSQQLWMDGWGGFSTSGSPPQLLIIPVFDSQRVTLFGLGAATFVESFQLEDGKEVVHFHPELWNWKFRRTALDFGKRHAEIMQKRKTGPDK